MVFKEDGIWLQALISEKVWYKVYGMVMATILYNGRESTDKLENMPPIGEVSKYVGDNKSGEIFGLDSMLWLYMVPLDWTKPMKIWI